MVRPLNAIGVPRGLNARAGGEYERRSHPVSEGGGGGGWGISPEKFFEFNMSVEAILMHYETIFACKIRLIVQEFHVAVFRCVSNPITKN